MVGGEGVDAGFLVYDIDLRHGHAGSQPHFFNDVPELALVGVVGVWIDEPSAERFGHRAAAAGKGGDFVKTSAGNDAQCAGGGEKNDLRIPKREFRTAAVAICP